MANRYQEDLKLIVGVEGSKSGNIPGHKPKDKIKGKRGIVYFNADGSSSSTTGNTPGTNEDGNKEEGTTQPAPGGADTGTSGGAYNGGNTLDGAGLTDPYPIDDPALPGAGIYSVDSMTLGDIVNGVTSLQDCATGDPVDVRFDGQFTAPDGWEDADTLPIDATYEEGYYWLCVSSDGSRHFSMNAAKASTYSYLLGQEQDDVPGVVDFTYEYEFIVVSVSAAKWIATEYDSRSAAYTTITEWQIQRYDCGASVEGYCNPSFDDLYSVLEWPSDKPTQLSFNADTGLWETHPLDGNVLPQYSQPVTSLSLCNGSGDSIKTFILADGGQAILNETTGIATFIDADGKVTGFGGAAEITYRQPR